MNEAGPIRRRGRVWRLLPLAAPLAFAACGGVEEIVMERFRGETPRERYVERLERSDLVHTALVRDWLRAADAALERPTAATPPLVEEGWLHVDSPSALGYRIELRQGERLRIGLELEAEPEAKVFIDVFRIRGDPAGESPSLITVAWADSTARDLTHDARVSATYLVRIQPELLRGGGYRVSLETGPSLAFPVEGAGMRDIGSFFGADRDGGARRHHGVDIFAPRGTPVVAASAGRVRRVSTTPIGGRVVWLRNEERGHSEYYAHLESQHVSSGQRVSRGDTIGFVGNSGNAVTTPPHLHFGIYSRGPVDPLPFIAPPPQAATPLRASRELIPSTVRIAPGGAAVRAGPWEGADTLPRGEPHLPVAVLAGSGGWLRVRLPDGSVGWVDHDRVAVLEHALAAARTPRPVVLRPAPDERTPGVRSLPAGAEVAVLGRFGEWAWVRPGPDEHPGWVRLPNTDEARAEGTPASASPEGARR